MTRMVASADARSNGRVPAMSRAVLDDLTRTITDQPDLFMAARPYVLRRVRRHHDGLRMIRRSAGDMKYGVDVAPVEAGNQPTSLLCGDGDEVCAATTSLLEDLGYDR